MEGVHGGGPWRGSTLEGVYLSRSSPLTRILHVPIDEGIRPGIDEGIDEGIDNYWI